MKPQHQKIGDDQLFYCLQRGISEDDAISMIVNGFVRMSFPSYRWNLLSKHKKLLAISLEHSVG